MDRTLVTTKIEEFLTWLEVDRQLSEHTLRAYKTDLKQIMLFWEDIEKKEPTVPLDVSALIRRYTIALFYKKLSKATLARKLSCFRSFQDYLKDQGIVVKGTFKSPRQEKKLPVVLSVDEIFYLLDKINDEDLPTSFPLRDKAIFELMYATGVRCSELVSIKLSDIDFNNRLIRVWGKGKKERIVLFGEKAEETVKKYLSVERPPLVATKSSEYLFVNYTGDGITQRSVQRIFEMFRKFLKINKNLTPHKIRHSFATHLLNQGVDLRVIQELLGHKTIATTEIYTHITSQELAKMCDEKHPLNDLELDQE